MYRLFNQEDYYKIIKCIDKYTYISFDMFDTLVKRDCFSPIELFRFIEKKLDQNFHKPSHFLKLRIQAEKKARLMSKSEEITIDGIYRYLQTNFSSEVLVQVQQWELEYEFSLCQMNPAIKPIYDYCISHNKKILIVTDIYLPESLIKNILKKLRIQYDSLFVSSTYMMTKACGTLFKKVLNSLSISSTDIIHIGDNANSDYAMPMKMGINAIHIDKDSKQNFFIDKKAYKDNSSYADLCSFISNHVSNKIIPNSLKNIENYFFQSGYEVEGPVLYGFVTWLQKELKKEKITKVYFLSRDGQIMQKAYNKLHDQFPNDYMYASRKALIIPTIWMNPELQDIQHIMFWPRAGTIYSFLNKIGLVPEEFTGLFVNKGFDCKKKYVYSDLWRNDDFISIYNDFIKEKAMTNSKQAYDLLVLYLKQLHFSHKVAIVDIGWFGHMQAALQKVIEASRLPIELYGYYIGLRPNSPLLESIHAKGYLFDKNRNPQNSAKEASFNALVEALFTANHGTTKSYKWDGEKIAPVLEKWEYKEEILQNDYIYIKSAQEGALTFVEDMLNESMHFNIEFNPKIAFFNWLQLGCHPSRKAANYFGNLHMLDDNLDFIARPKSGGGYLLNIGTLKKELLHSRWRVGFLTRLWGNKVPYYQLYAYLKRLI